MTYAQEKVNPYGKAGTKGELVRQMFDHIAPTYDRLNHNLSWSIDKSWRKRAVTALAELNPKRILDIATGTADLAILSAQILHPESIVGADISERMMDIGQRKVEEAGLTDVISFKKEDCMHLSFDNESFDAVTSAFGIRNFQNLDACLSEVFRVLRNGGIFSVVEATTPRNFPMKQLFSFYSNKVIPLWGKVISGDKGAYEYLSRSVEAFPQGEEMRGILLKAGFRRVEFRRLTFGICTQYIAMK